MMYVVVFVACLLISLPGCSGASLRHVTHVPDSMKLHGAVHPPPAAVNGTNGADHSRIAMIEEWVSIIIYSVTSCIGLAATALLVCLIFDAIARWLHAARFHSCQKKVKRVHAELVGLQGQLSLCPYCVTSVSNQPSSMHVVFLCGHRFHMDCVNQWFREAPQLSGQCPICFRADGYGKDAIKDAETAVPTGIEDECKACLSESAVQCTDKTNTEKTKGDEASASPDPLMNCSDEGKSFMLIRLHELYPDIISKECVKRWCSCHTEIWLSELNCPRYNSLFNKHKWTRSK